eukprot:Gregarina_sp_Poly_1__2882@NODE_1803_length_3302_cov_190_013910_g689_i1_p5_GENE_NODE_1803_length_3302_cov_190_013910_g689_i1NODE_1803_length_3302_cov_190_013910_g689_i1_p5_ORF_typecomplete_len115_score18_75ToxSHH/PF15652_6/0_0088Rho_Binding/PF08912_11/0_052HTH_Bact/PF18768_1/0_16_NODE_1803_length_3302_cov_190_013910_g689_i1289633
MSLFNMVSDSVAEFVKAYSNAPRELPVPEDYDDLKHLYYSQVDANAALLYERGLLHDKLKQAEREIRKLRKVANANITRDNLVAFESFYSDLKNLDKVPQQERTSKQAAIDSII